ncbi:hypothetical protein EJ05DRAFT_285729 [Pseudovirgaria hyperparasitica]|uniref:Zincin n=1 Tax=Pseudovirgaria hyperparasitica TaxID=470096 RepID=A0A6A6WCB0_9PEZI|nr:uncharacterized protein EJ05DRAFT_285729 [Pseudovirgaria hyperparasitica]KAF2760472.1 hypothetical protein EJ05DRAFT_285729 [Pseudovirgaria hyperparasitica]
MHATSVSSAVFLALIAIVDANQGSFAPLTKRELDKPVIQPPFYDNKLVPALNESLQTTEHTIDLWANNSIPSICKSAIEEQAVDGVLLTSGPVEVFSVTYADCDTPWIMCRHPTASASRQTMAELFGKLPVRHRSFVRHLSAAGGDSGAYSSGDNVFMAGDSSLAVTVYGHEVGHSLDAHFFGNETGFTETDAWLEAYDEDEVVVQDYAQASQAENFAQMVNVAIYTLNFPGGIANLAPNWQQFSHMLDLMTNELKDVLTQGGECRNRLENSPLVSKSGFGSQTSSVLSSESSSTVMTIASPTSSPAPGTRTRALHRRQRQHQAK